MDDLVLEGILFKRFVIIIMIVNSCGADTLAAVVEASLAVEDHHEPCKKKARVAGGVGTGGSGADGGGATVGLKLRPEKLEHRLGGILCCAVCLDLPKSAIYQVI